MATLFLVALLGFLAVRRKILNTEGINGITRLIVDVVVPAKMIDGLLVGLNPEVLSRSAVVMLVMVGWTFIGLILGWLGTRLWPRKGHPEEDHAIVALSGLQNGVYLPLPLMMAILPQHLHAEATIYVGGAFLVLSCTQWTLGVFLLRGEEARRMSGQSVVSSLRNAFNGPLIGVFVGVALAQIPILSQAARGGEAPRAVTAVVKAIHVAGEALSPLAMILLGMMIGDCRLRESFRLRPMAIPVLVRLVISPLLMFLAMRSSLLGWVPPLVALTLMIETASPPATNLSVIARRYGGDWESVSSVLLITYLLALGTVPFWAGTVVK